MTPMSERTAWLAVAFLLLGVGAWVLVLLTAAPIAEDVQTGAADEDWVDALQNAVYIHRRGGGGYPGVVYEPYLGQLQVVRAHLRRGDEAATYAAMNRLMDMLERRENDIPAATADWLFDFCYLVTPAKYHDVSRHIRKFKEHRFGEPIG